MFNSNIVLPSNSDFLGTAHFRPRTHPFVGIYDTEQRNAPSAELPALPLPFDRERLHQMSELRCPTPVQDVLDDVGGEEREPQDAADVGAAYAFGMRQLGERSVLAALQHPLPSPRPRERLGRFSSDAKVDPAQ